LLPVWLGSGPDDLKAVPLALCLWSFDNIVRFREKMGTIVIFPHIAVIPFGNRKWQQLLEIALENSIIITLSRYLLSIL
jgi:hypothetical protein